MVQIVLCHPAEAEFIEVAESDSREGQPGCGHFIQLGDMGVEEVVLDPLCADIGQQGHRAQEAESPDDALEGQPLIGDDVGQAMQSGATGKGLDTDWMAILHLLLIHFQVHHSQG